MKRRTDRRLALLAGGALALLFTMIAAVQVAAWSVGREERISHRELTGTYSHISVESQNGDVVVMRSADGKVRVDARATGTLNAPAPSIDVEGPRVRVAANCPVWGFGECHSDVTVQVPAGTEVRVDAASGDVVAQNLPGGAELKTSSGDVVVDGASGDLSLETSSGDVVARGLTSSLTKARTSSGDVDLRFASPPTAAEAMTSSGDARILVPPGAEEYQVTVDSDSGRTDAGVRQGGDQRFLRAETNSGDAVVDYGGG
jgi:DUF4097 and DUF4098 domain-containing protein YvlB